MTMIRISVGPYEFLARLEEEAAPQTCLAFASLLPLRGRLFQARWSGQSAFMPLGDLCLNLPAENATSYPAPGQLLLYPKGISETEILFPYGPTCFASKAGQLAGNHFLTLMADTGELASLGETVWHQGAQDIEFSRT